MAATLHEIKINKIQQKINFDIQNNFIIFNNHDLKMSHLDTVNFNFLKITVVRLLRSGNLVLSVCSIKNAKFLNCFSMIFDSKSNAVMQKEFYGILLHAFKTFETEFKIISKIQKKSYVCQRVSFEKSEKSKKTLNTLND